jgi:hypothetical protein
MSGITRLAATARQTKVRLSNIVTWRALSQLGPSKSRRTRLARLRLLSGDQPPELRQQLGGRRIRDLAQPGQQLPRKIQVRQCSAPHACCLLNCKFATPQQIGASGEQGYTDNAKPISSRMPKPATAGPTTACQRDGLICAGCSPLRSLAKVPSQPNGSSIGRPRIEVWGGLYGA